MATHMPRSPLAPAIAPRRTPTGPVWQSARKVGIGTARSADSRVWFTLADGILTEMYHPTVDAARVRGCQFLVSDGRSFVHDEQHDMTSTLVVPDPGVPAYHIETRDPAGRYRLLKRVITDPRHDAVLVEATFVPAGAATRELELYLELEPLLGGDGRHASARLVEHAGHKALVAWRGDTAVAVATTAEVAATSCGHAGISDGRTRLTEHFQLDARASEVHDAQVVLTAKLLPGATPFVVAIGFGQTPEAAVDMARGALAGSFEHAYEHYVRDWQDYLATLSLERLEHQTHDHGRLLRASAMVLAVLEDKRHAGAAIASPCVPWGEQTPAHGLVHAQVVRPRDLYHMATARFALGDLGAPARALAHFIRHQDATGAWPNEATVDGRAFGPDAAPTQVAFPILLAWQLREVVDPIASGAWAMVRAAALHLAVHRPAGNRAWRSHSVGTLAAEIAALACAAELARIAGETALATYFMQLAIAWEGRLERRAFARCERCRQGDTSHRGHYKHVVPPRRATTSEPACEVDPSFLDLVRFGVRPATDPRLEATLAAVDRHLRVVAPHAPAWRRYHGDVAGEAGAPGDRRGRAWPLLTGERGHYELALGHQRDASHLLHAMERLANAGGMLPEQVWDEVEPAAAGVAFGQGTGAATPHGWAHAEYVKLARSLADGRGFDTVEAARRLFAQDRPEPGLAIWNFNEPIARLDAGEVLRIEVYAPAELHWSWDDWHGVGHTPLAPIAPGVWAWTSPGPLAVGDHLDFTFYWPEAGHWEERNYRITAD